ncbi:MAG: T9SS type A sorting domain-containing protein, partial [Bacteroidetes bacterium]|nr:T9SS type A sorting domain-containing protein [Bacteroidota bacterium]
EDTPAYHSASGAVIRAASSNGDYVLAELLEDVPAEYDVFLAGWSIDDNASASSVVLGHPKGDLKKITFDDDPLMTYRYSSMYWEARFDRGTIEASSSGSPLFNDAYQFVGHVKSARWMDANACSGDGGDDNNAAILFPKLSYTWDQADPGQRVSDFLDPDGTGITSLGGHRASESPPPSDPPVELWINEVNADAANGEEFVEIVGTAGADFTDYAVEIHSCSAGASTLERTETISSSYTFVDESHGYGFFLMSGSSLSSSEIDVYFETPDTDVLPDGSGIILVKNPSGEEVFGYQYDDTQGGAPVNCPTGRTTRSGGDASGSGSMGFTVDYMPSDTDLGTNSIITSPGVSNSDGGQNLPVELVAFTATADGRDAVLRWETASETNNAGFEVQRLDDAGWSALTFVDGHGTTETPQRYQQRVEALEAGSHRFRLKQIDFDGTFEYSPEVEVYIDLPDAFVVDPVYPNPFNPQATLRFGVQQTQHVQVHLYNTLGQRVDTLYDREMPAGQVVTLTIDGSDLPSGTYFVHAQGRSIRHTQSITLVR